jgi:hypothetical protein
MEQHRITQPGAWRTVPLRPRLVVRWGVLFLGVVRRKVLFLGGILLILGGAVIQKIL